MNLLQQLCFSLQQADAVLVRVQSSRGSVPREAGAWMAVFAKATLGTIGGGRLELDAMAVAQALLQDAASAPRTERYALGPSLGQCCGGEVHLQYARVGVADISALQQQLRPPHQPVALFGGGHVGRALVQVLGNLPMDVSWIDSRDEIFPDHVPETVQCEHSDPVHGAVAKLVPGTCVVIMSFSHAEDLDIVAACLARQRAQADLPYIGLIGSRTKWATFRKRLLVRGFSDAELDHVTSPIGVPGIADKRPEVIAVAVAAQLLQVTSH